MSELFANFEVNKQPRWPIVSKLLAASLVMHVSIAACVVYFPPLRSAFNLASLIADTRFVDRAYEKTQIGDDVQLVELASDKFHYPEGYFAPEGQMPVERPPAPDAPVFISQAQPPAVMPEVALSPSPTPALNASPSPAANARFCRRRTVQANPTPAQSPAMTADKHKLNSIRLLKRIISASRRKNGSTRRR